MLPAYIQLAFLSKAYLSRDGATHKGLGLPTSIRNQENITDMPTGGGDGGSSSTEIPSSQVWQVDN